MGVRQIRYCDISGVEGDVDQHEIHIDQMRIEIDLSGSEYRKLLEVLRPYMDAGVVEASGRGLPAKVKSARRARRKPDAPADAAVVGEQPEAPMARSSALSAEQRQQVRQWAMARGMEVPVNNRFKGSLVEAWREETGGSDM